MAQVVLHLSRHRGTVREGRKSTAYGSGRPSVMRFRAAELQNGVLAVMPVLGTDWAYKQVRNWLCQREDLNTSYLLLVALHSTTLRPGQESVLPKPQLDACIAAVQAVNERAERSAVDLARRAHLVYVAEASGFLDPGKDCGAAGNWKREPHLFSLAHARAVGGLLGLGVNVLVTTMGSFLRDDPAPCTTGPEALDVASWALMKPPPTNTLQAFVLSVKSTRAGLSAYTNFLRKWESQGGIQELKTLASASFEAVFEPLQTVVLRPESQERLPNGTEGCVSSRLAEAGEGKKPAPILMVAGGAAGMRRKNLWIIDDVFYACRWVKCKREEKWVKWLRNMSGNDSFA